MVNHPNRNLRLLVLTRCAPRGAPTADIFRWNEEESGEFQRAVSSEVLTNNDYLTTIGCVGWAEVDEFLRSEGRRHGFGDWSERGLRGPRIYITHELQPLFPRQSP